MLCCIREAASSIEHTLNALAEMAVMVLMLMLPPPPLQQREAHPRESLVQVVLK